MKNGKIYNLATAKAIPLHKSTSLLPTSPNANIFTDYRRKWHARRELDSSKGYEVVGLKELKAYQTRLKKASRATIRADSLSTERAISKASSELKKSGPNLLTKEEVIECVPKTHETAPMPLPVKKRTKRKRESWMTFSTDNMNHPQATLDEESKLQGSLCSHFSLARLKKRMGEHRKEWSKHEYQEGKFPDIYRSIEMHRLKLERREREGKTHEDLVVTRSNLWGETLRTSKGMRDLCLKKELAKTIYDENCFMARGHSKMDAQREWLERKDEAGFRFKLCPPILTEETKKTVVIR